MSVNWLICYIGVATVCQLVTLECCMSVNWCTGVLSVYRLSIGYSGELSVCQFLTLYGVLSVYQLVTLWGVVCLSNGYVGVY